MADVLHSNNFDRGFKKSDKNNELEYYEERLSKRRDKKKEEEKLNDFLHNSLRTSERLKPLEKSKRLNFKVNDAYMDEGWEDDHAIDVTGLTDALCNRKNMKTALARSDLDWLQRFVRKDIFKMSYNSCMALNEILKRYDCPPLTGSGAARLSVESVIDHVTGNVQRSKESHYKFQMRELLQLLSSPEIQSVCEANDCCANIIEKNARSRRECNGQEPRYPGTCIDVVTANSKKTSPSSVVSQNGVSNRTITPPSTLTAKSPLDTTRVIKSQLKGCYAQVYQTDKGITLKTVVLEKGTQPLGATVRNERDAVVVGRIVVGGVAHRSGLLKEGDELLSVDGIELTGKDVNEVSDILARMRGTIKFLVAPCDESATITMAQPLQTTMIHLRSLFTYNPEDDLYIPCKDIGLAFERGDILHVTNVQDPNWWQAYKDVDGNGSGSLGDLAGLVPSPDYQYKREILRKKLNGDKDMMDMYASTRGESSMLCLKKHRKNQTATMNGGWVYNADINGRSSYADNLGAGRKRKHTKKSDRSTYCPGDMELNQPDPDINTYEEVQMFLPQPHRKRPVVFVGLDLIGRTELARKIVDSDTEQFSMVKQHTTLDTRSNDYRHVTKEEFKHLLNQEEFIETGIFEKNWYGTSKPEIKSVIDAGKTAVLVLQPESLIAIRKTNFLPYVIFVSPPTKIEGLRHLKSTVEQDRTSDEELFTTINRAKMIDFRFGYMFDRVLTMDSFQQAFDDALTMISRLDRDTQWVPSRWLSQRPVSQMP